MTWGRLLKRVETPEPDNDAITVTHATLDSLAADVERAHCDWLAAKTKLADAEDDVKETADLLERAREAFMKRAAEQMPSWMEWPKVQEAEG